MLGVRVMRTNIYIYIWRPG